MAPRGFHAKVAKLASPFPGQRQLRFATRLYQHYREKPWRTTQGHVQGNSPHTSFAQDKKSILQQEPIAMTIFRELKELLYILVAKNALNDNVRRAMNSLEGLCCFAMNRTGPAVCFDDRDSQIGS